MFVFIIIVAGLSMSVDLPQGPNIALGNIRREIKVRLGLDLQGGTSLTYEADMKNVPDGDRKDALEGLRDVIERRVNEFGVSEPVVRVNQSGAASRLIVELPGVTDVEAAIAQIGETPLLEFREEAEIPKRTEEEKAAIRKLNEEQKKKAEEVLQKALAQGADFSALAKEYSEDTGSKENGGDLDFFGKEQMIEEFEKAAFAGEVGKVVPNLVQTPFGYHIIKVTDKRQVPGDKDGEQKDEVRASHILLRTQSEEAEQPAFPNYVNTGLNGQHLKRATVVFASTLSQPEVQLEFNDEGKKLFGEITERNIGKSVAIYLDGSPISIPTVQAAIKTGEAVIQGSFAVDEAKQLARRLNAGALPVPIALVNQQNIGPSLGEIALQKSFFAGVIGMLALAFFMIAYYRLPGFVAILALGVYGLLSLALFKLIPVTLSLAGIAGFILSIGMAVDANVLIFERMKEEWGLGKSLKNAIEDGFSRAWLAIRDSNASSLITCFILATFSTSLIKGFAITLALGIVVSLFSAITVTRTLLRIIAEFVGEERLTTLFGLKKRNS